MSKFMAIIIDSLNHDISISSVLNPTDKIHALIAKHNAERFGSVKIKTRQERAINFPAVSLCHLAVFEE